MFALNRKKTRCNVSALVEPAHEFAPSSSGSSDKANGRLKVSRSRKHEIDFLIRSDVEPQHKRRKNNCVASNSLSHLSPVSVREPTPMSSTSIPGPPPQPPHFLLSESSRSTQPSHPSAIASHVQCSECCFSSRKAAEVVAHARLAHPAKPFACYECGRCFTEKGNMNKHYRTVHLRERKHSCKQCHRSFAFLDGLNRHISMVHLDKRPFKCTVCLCKVRHANSGLCPFTCGMRFKQKSHYRRHVRSVHHIELAH